MEKKVEVRNDRVLCMFISSLCVVTILLMVTRVF